MTGDLSQHLATLLKEAEQSRLRREGWSSAIDIVVEECPITDALGIKFYQGYNGLEDPSWIYTVGVDQGAVLYRISGFATTEYGGLTKRWLARRGGLTESEIVTIVATYFSVVEEWQPGVAESASDMEAVRRALDQSADGKASKQASKAAPTLPMIRRNGVAAEVTATLFDARSKRVENVLVELSPDNGLVVRSRVTLADRPRLRY